MADSDPTGLPAKLWALVGGAALAAFGLCHGGDQAAAKPDSATVKGTVSAAVRLVYRQRCQRCHEADGTGGATDSPDFTDVRWQKSRTDLQFLVSILDGKGAGMPGFRSKIGDDQARELVTMVREFAVRGGTAADFDARFRQLQNELAALQQQFRELSGTPKAVQTDR